MLAIHFPILRRVGTFTQELFLCNGFFFLNQVLILITMVTKHLKIASANQQISVKWPLETKLEEGFCSGGENGHCGVLRY